MVLENNLFPPWQNKAAVEFKLDGKSGDFINSEEGEELEDFIQAGLRARLGARVNLGQSAPPAGTEDGG